VNPDFWQERWQNRQIGFHRDEPHPMLINHLSALDLSAGDRIFLPLCGKTVDISYLLSKGLEVIGIELVDSAVQELFAELNVAPQMEPAAGDKLKRYSSSGLAVYSGDIFELDAETLGVVDAVYDRAALVALPETMRQSYTDHLQRITANAQQLLISFEYDQAIMHGPPFSVPATAVHNYYGGPFTVQELERKGPTEMLRPGIPVLEVAWYLKPPST
jgi:thiopurine S-methyltransferase